MSRGLVLPIQLPNNLTLESTDFDLLMCVEYQDIRIVQGDNTGFKYKYIIKINTYITDSSSHMSPGQVLGVSSCCY